jgi:drug/metabolite transporter (DMT)-like permease
LQSFKLLNVLVLLTVGTVAASSFLFMKILVDEITPSEIVAGRVFFGALALAAVIRVKRTPLKLSRSLMVRVFIFAAFETVIPFTLIATAEQNVDSGLAAVLISGMPLFTVLFATLTPTGERLSRIGFIGLAVGFLGIVVLSGVSPGALVDGDALSRIAVLAAAASYAAAGVYARLLLKTENTLSVSGLQLGFATLIAVPLIFAGGDTPSFDLSLGGFGALLTLGIVGSGGMLLGFLWLVEKTGSIGASLVTYVVPFMGVFLGWAVLGETIGDRTVLGLVLVLAGVGVATFGGIMTASSGRRRQGSAPVLQGEGASPRRTWSNASP